MPGAPWYLTCNLLLYTCLKGKIKMQDYAPKQCNESHVCILSIYHLSSFYYVVGLYSVVVHSSHALLMYCPIMYSKLWIWELWVPWSCWCDWTPQWQKLPKVCWQNAHSCYVLWWVSAKVTLLLFIQYRTNLGCWFILEQEIILNILYNTI